MACSGLTDATTSAMATSFDASGIGAGARAAAVTRNTSCVTVDATCRARDCRGSSSIVSALAGVLVRNMAMGRPVAITSSTPVSLSRIADRRALWYGGA